MNEIDNYPTKPKTVGQMIFHKENIDGKDIFSLWEVRSFVIDKVTIFATLQQALILFDIENITVFCKKLQSNVVPKTKYFNVSDVSLVRLTDNSNIPNESNKIQNQ